MNLSFRHSLEQVARGDIDAGTARNRVLDALRAQPYEDLGFARVDHHRSVRQGFPEVILGLGKTPAQIAAIAAEIVGRGSTLLVTRATEAAYAAVRAQVPGAIYHADASIIAFPQQDVSARQRDDRRRRRRHLGPAGRRGSGADGGADGQRGRRGCTTSASPGSTACSASAPASPPPASSSSSPAWKARCRASSPAW